MIPRRPSSDDAGAERIPARQIDDAMQMQPARPAEEVLPGAVDVQRNADGSVDVRRAAPESVALRRTDDGGVEIGKVDPAAAGSRCGACRARSHRTVRCPG
jgi:hypothetical protein